MVRVCASIGLRGGRAVRYIHTLHASPDLRLCILLPTATYVYSNQRSKIFLRGWCVCVRVGVSGGSASYLLVTVYVWTLLDYTWGGTDGVI